MDAGYLSLPFGIEGMFWKVAVFRTLSGLSSSKLLYEEELECHEGWIEPASDPEMGKEVGGLFKLVSEELLIRTELPSQWTV